MSLFTSCQGYLAGGVFYDERTETTNPYTPQRWTGIQKDSLVDGHIRQYREVLLPQQRTDGESYICCVSLLRQAACADTKKKAAEVLFGSVSGDMVEQKS